MLEEKVMLADIIRNFDVQSMQNSEDMVLVSEIVVRSKHGFKVTLRSRETN
jgi:hypothetical protein